MGICGAAATWKGIGWIPVDQDANMHIIWAFVKIVPRYRHAGGDAGRWGHAWHHRGKRMGSIGHLCAPFARACEAS